MYFRYQIMGLTHTQRFIYQWLNTQVLAETKWTGPKPIEPKSGLRSSSRQVAGLEAKLGCPLSTAPLPSPSESAISFKPRCQASLKTTLWTAVWICRVSTLIGLSFDIPFISAGANLVANRDILQYVSYLSPYRLLWERRGNVVFKRPMSGTKGHGESVPFSSMCISIMQLVLFPKVALRSESWRRKLYKWPKLCESVEHYIFIISS